MDLRTAPRNAALAFFHEVPSVGDLNGVRERLCGRLTISAAAIARDDLDLRVIDQPGPHRRRFTIG